MKVALITGVTGQDGSYLSELLLEKGYIVHGIKRRASSFNTQRIDHIYQDLHGSNVNFKLHYGDLTDSMNIIRIIQEVQPDEIYNLGAMSHVKVSFDSPEYVANVDGLGTLRILEAVRILGLEQKTRIYQASTSELYGGLAITNPKMAPNKVGGMKLILSFCGFLCPLSRAEPWKEVTFDEVVTPSFIRYPMINPPSIQPQIASPI